MNNYEVLYILDNMEDEAREALIAKFSQLVVDNGGEVANVDKWGVKKFAYPINYKNEVYYVLMNFAAPASVPSELERVMKITDGVVRCMVVRK